MEAEAKGLTIFSAVKKRLDWLTQRQEILAQNIANADTPEYAAKDLKPFQFRDLIRRETAQLNLTTTGDSHLGGARKRIRDFQEVEVRKPFETSPNGNSVVVEEQIGKVGETESYHRLTTELYRKQMEMFQIAGRPPR